MERKLWKICAFYFLCVLIWGTGYYLVRMSMQPEGGYMALTGAAMRFTIAMLILAACLWRERASRDRSPRDRNAIYWTIAAGVLNGLAYGFMYKAEETVQSGLAAMLHSTLPLFTAILAVASGAERVRYGTVVGSLFSVGGVCLLFMGDIQVTGMAGAMILVLLSSAIGGGSSVMLKKHAESLSTVSKLFWFFAGSTAVLWASAVAQGESLPTTFAAVPNIAMLALAIGSVVAFFGFIYLMKINLMLTTTIMFFQLLLAQLLDWLFEPSWQLSTLGSLGIFVILSGVTLTLSDNDALTGMLKERTAFLRAAWRRV